MTADLLSTTDPRWGLPETVSAIAAGTGWSDQVRQFWAHVSPAAHDLAHPRPVYACPGCPQVENCPSCGLPIEVCENPVGHYRTSREGESGLRSGVGSYGREVSR